MDDELIALLTRVICVLDLLWDPTKEQVGIWSIISDLIQEMLLLLEKERPAFVTQAPPL